jgi:hypothetical protein
MCEEDFANSTRPSKQNNQAGAISHPWGKVTVLKPATTPKGLPKPSIAGYRAGRCRSPKREPKALQYPFWLLNDSALSFLPAV